MRDWVLLRHGSFSAVRCTKLSMSNGSLTSPAGVPTRPRSRRKDVSKELILLLQRSTFILANAQARFTASFPLNCSHRAAVSVAKSATNGSEASSEALHNRNLYSKECQQSEGRTHASSFATAQATIPRSLVVNACICTELAFTRAVTSCCSSFGTTWASDQQIPMFHLLQHRQC